jgi:phosphoribosylaminoimidazole-succinocarboxamide synthase
VPNQLTGVDPESVVAENEREQVRGRSVVVKRLRPLPIEAVVRGYVIGSGWKDYKETGAICGIALPAGLKMAQKLPSPIFTPATKADVGDHDENVSFATAQANCGAALAEALAGTGSNPPSYDKQYVRDYLETLDWGKVAPGPKLPADVIARTSAKYIEAYEKLTGKTL